MAHAVEMQRLTRIEARFVVETEYLETEEKVTSYWLQTIPCSKKNAFMNQFATGEVLHTNAIEFEEGHAVCKCRFYSVHINVTTYISIYIFVENCKIF